MVRVTCTCCPDFPDTISGTSFIDGRLGSILSFLQEESISKVAIAKKLKNTISLALVRIRVFILILLFEVVMVVFRLAMVASNVLFLPVIFLLFQVLIYI